MNNDLLLVLTPTTTIVVEAAKRAGLPNKFAYLLALFLGILYGILLAVSDKNPLSFFSGLFASMAGVGVYEGIKTGLESVKLLKNKQENAL